MTPLALIILLAALAVALIVAELLLPTHGFLAMSGMVCAAASIGICFLVNKWLGLGVCVAAIALGPVIAALFITYWPRTPLGRRVVLPPTTTVPLPPPVYIGQVGVARAALRPTGEVEFDAQPGAGAGPLNLPVRVEAVSELGLIAAGTKVRVVALMNGKPRVRPVTEA